MSKDNENYIPLKEIVIGGALFLLGSGGIYLSLDYLGLINPEVSLESSLNQDTPFNRKPASTATEYIMTEADPNAMTVIEGNILVPSEEDLYQEEEIEEELVAENTTVNGPVVYDNTSENAPTTDNSFVRDNGEEKVRPPKEGANGEEPCTSCTTNVINPLPIDNEEDNDIDEGENSDSGNDEEIVNEPNIDESPASLVTFEGPGFQCYLNRAQGVYNGLTAVSIGCSELANISYCLTTGSATCDPVSSPTTYTAPVNVGPADGIYSFSYVATSAGTGEVTEVYHKRFVIDSGALSMEAVFNSLFVQSTEVSPMDTAYLDQLPQIVETTSANFGSLNHYYSHKNLVVNDPGVEGLDLSCADLYAEIPNLREPAAINIVDSYDVSGMTSGDTFEHESDHDSVVTETHLENGTNMLVTFVENRAATKTICQFEKINKNDFPMGAFSSGGPTSVVGNVKETTGHFTSFGHFQADPTAGIEVGANENEQSGTVLKNDIISIFF